MKEYKTDKKELLKLGEIIRIDDVLHIVVDGRCDECRYQDHYCNLFKCSMHTKIEKLENIEKVKTYDFQVGQVFEFDGELLQVVKSDECDDCYLDDNCIESLVFCDSNKRKDETDVSFKYICKA